MKIVSRIACLALVSTVFMSAGMAKNITIRCDQNPQSLENIFTNHWQQNSSGPYKYISIANKIMGDRNLIGAVHAMTTTLPADKNPHLSFLEISANNIEHYQLWHVDCQYRIGNKIIEDLGNNLHMTVGISNYDYNCRKIDYRTVECVGK